MMGEGIGGNADRWERQKMGKGIGGGGDRWKWESDKLEMKSVLFFSF